MCRFVLYLGAEVRVSSLITEPVNSIIHQSFHSHERSEPLNGDGFGLAWYPPQHVDLPALFRSTTPAWSNRNLTEISRVTRTRCVLAHVRAATPGLPVTDFNCHPFVTGRLAFMHNGDWGGFQQIRQRLVGELSPEAFASIEGSTDSEHIFAVFIDRLRALEQGDPTERMATAIEDTIRYVETLRQAVAPDEPSSLNLAVSDGERAIVTRYASGHGEANSLYFNTGRTYICDQGSCRVQDEGSAHSAVIVASEPLDDDERWTRVEPGHLLCVTPDLDVFTRAIDLERPRIGAK